jgi:hypothetical protein
MTTPESPLGARPDALWSAASHGDALSLAQALAEGADPNARCALRRWPPLMHVVFQSQGLADDPLECARILLAAGADPLAALPEGDTILARATEYDLALFEQLWKAAAPARRPSPASLLSQTPRCTHDVALVLVRLAGDPDSPLAHGETPLARALRERAWDAASSLLDAGASAPRVIRNLGGREVPLARWMRDVLEDTTHEIERTEVTRLFERLTARTGEAEVSSVASLTTRAR